MTRSRRAERRYAFQPPPPDDLGGYLVLGAVGLVVGLIVLVLALT